jgi:hypothetical protein
MGYGYEVKGPNDQKVNDAKNMARLASEAALPGALLVNNLPFCEFSLWYRTRSALIRPSAMYPRMASVVEL